MNSSSYEAFETFEADEPVVTECHLTRLYKSGHSPMRDEFAHVLVNVGACQIGVSLLFDGSLKLPAGVLVPLDLQQRVKREAQRLAIERLAQEWRMQRDRDGRYVDPGEP